MKRPDGNDISIITFARITRRGASVPRFGWGRLPPRAKMEVAPPRQPPPAPGGGVAACSPNEHRR
eukprot:1323014-Alexandrium_andersonii.AAC.1